MAHQQHGYRSSHLWVKPTDNHRNSHIARCPADGRLWFETIHKNVHFYLGSQTSSQPERLVPLQLSSRTH